MFIYKSIILIFLISLTSLTSNNGYAGDIYKWTDKDGMVHFGDIPDDYPSDNPASIYKIPKNNNSNVSSSNKERANKQRKLLDSFAAERKEKREIQAKKSEERKVRKYNCKISKDKLVRFNDARRIYVRNDVGEKIFLTEQQRKKETNLLREQVKTWCD